jgi:predicted choloylglycine hydrolase
MIKQNKIYEFSGTHYELGFQQGKVFAEFAEKLVEMFKNLEEIQSLKPEPIPIDAFLKFASKKAYRSLNKILNKYAPNQAERIKGIAEGSGLDEKIMYLFSAAELLLGDLDWELPHLKTGCTSIAYKSSKTEAGHTMISRNFDYAKFIVPYLMLRKNEPTGFNISYDLTAMILPGTFNGVNVHGVFIGTDEAFPLDEKEEGLAASIIIQEALENCKSTEEVVKFFEKIPRGSGNVILVADPSDDIRVLEYTSKRLRVRTPNNEDEFIVGTNHFTFEDLKPIDLPREAVFGKKSAECLWGVCINETSFVRKDTAEKMIRPVDKVNVEWLQKLHRDHSASPDNQGGMETICHHDPANISAASMIIDLETLDSWFCFGLPCENEYNQFNLKG